MSDGTDERKPNTDIKFWLEEIAAAKKREKDYRKGGTRVLEIYDGTKAKTTPFNILFSNTETMTPALYSATPRPVVQRRFKDEDPLGKHAALAGKRVLEFLLDTNLEGYDTYDASMKHVTLDAGLPGRGWATVKYDAEMGEYEQQEGETEPTPYVKSELVCTEAKQWDRIYHGYAKKWNKVPWVAYEGYIDKEEAVEKFGKDVAGKLRYSDNDEAESDKESPRTNEEKSRGEKRMACFYEIWDKDGWGNQGKRKILWISPGYKDGYLKVADDELGLTGFFNCPKPLQFVDKTHSLVPTALYALYENQAEELNKIQRRINRLVEACKARGLYDGALGGDLSKLFAAEENELIPTENSASLSAERGMSNAIYFMPLDQIRQVLMDLYNARESCKQVIYEITGISDILRGASKASETLGAQEIKTQWGTLRLKNKQKEVARYARDLLRMMLELAASKFSEETWAKMTGLPFITSAKLNELTAIHQALKAQLQAMPAPTPGPNGEPPQPPQEVMQLQQIEQQLQAPKWAEVIGLLRDDMQRAYRVDIETNSTVEPEAAEDHKHIQEMMMTLGQVLQGLTPLVVSGTMPFQIVQDLLLVIARRYRFGNEIEDHIKAMQPPKPPDENGAEQVKKEKEFAQKEIQMKQKEAEGAIKSKDLDHQMNVKHREMQLAMKEMQLQIRELQAQHDKSMAEMDLRMKEQMAGKNIQMKGQEAAFKVKQAQQQSQQQRQQQSQRRSA
jgi:hypothetical protein